METAVGRGTQRPPEVWEQKHRLRSVCLTHHISLYEWLLPEVNIKTIRSCAAFSMTVAWHTSLTRWTAESFLESKGQRLLKHEFGSFAVKCTLYVSVFCEWRTAARLQSKGNAWVNRWQGNYQWAPFERIVWNHPLWKRRTIVRSTPRPGTYNGRALGLDLNADRKPEAGLLQAFIQIQHFRGSFRPEETHF